MNESQVIEALKRYPKVGLNHNGFRYCANYEPLTGQWFVGVMPNRIDLFWCKSDEDSQWHEKTFKDIRFHAQSNTYSEKRDNARFFIKEGNEYSIGQNRQHYENQLFFELVVWGVDQNNTVKSINNGIFKNEIDVREVVNFTSIPDRFVVKWPFRVV